MSEDITTITDASIIGINAQDQKQLPQQQSQPQQQQQCANRIKTTNDCRPKRKKPGFHEEMFQETSYYFKNGLRYVYPYAFTFTAHIKKRWLDLKVLDVFKREFHMESVEYYENAIKIGKIKVNDKLVTRDRILTSKDILKTTVHRHEPPVIHEDVEFLLNDDEMVVINKPASIPVHPCGRYRHNTIVFILGKEHGLGRLHTIHRIDRLTSGILMFAKTPKKAKEMEAAVHGRSVEKEYLARVVGDFPSDEDISVNEPLLTMSHKIGVCQVHPDGKPCSTTFTKISYNGKSSLIRCKPFTGRMHQIRVHLQWLGYPILNDPIYNHKTAWGEGKGKQGTKIDVKLVVAELIRTRKDKSYDKETETTDVDTTLSNTLSDSIPTDGNLKSSLADPISSNGTPTDSNLKIPTENEECPSKRTKFDVETDAVETPPLIIHKENIRIEEECKDEDMSYTSLDLGEEYYDSSCTECKRRWMEPYKSELVMYLHAHTYKGPGWEYKTSIPEWASETWNLD